MITHRHRIATAVVAFTFLAACSAVRDSLPQTVDEAYAVAQSGLIAAYNATADLLIAQQITKAEAIEVRTGLERVEMMLKMARVTLDRRDPTGALEWIRAANDILIPILRDLAEAQGRHTA